MSKATSAQGRPSVDPVCGDKAQIVSVSVESWRFVECCVVYFEWNVVDGRWAPHLGRSSVHIDGVERNALRESLPDEKRVCHSIPVGSES